MGNLLMPVRPRPFHVRCRVHTLPADVLMADLRGDLLQECGDHYYACVIFDDGRGVFVPSSAWAVWEPDEERREWIKQLTLLSNLHAANDGAWVYAWSEVNCWVGIWMDRDGDMRASHYDEGALARMKRNIGLDGYIDNANKTIKRMLEWEKDVDISLAQRYRQALGEKPPTPSV